MQHLSRLTFVAYILNCTVYYFQLILPTSCAYEKASLMNCILPRKQGKQKYEEFYEAVLGVSTISV